MPDFLGDADLGGGYELPCLERLTESTVRGV